MRQVSITRVLELPRLSYRVEGSQPLYRDLPVYPNPPLPPLPKPFDRAALVERGVEPRRLARAIVRAESGLTGFGRFLRDLRDEDLDELLKTHGMRRGACGPLDSATIVLDDDPTCSDMSTRASSLIVAARLLHDDLRSGVLPPDRNGDGVLEMRAYLNCFGTQIVPGTRARLHQSSRVANVLVMLGGEPFIVRTAGAVEDIDAGVIRESLESLPALASRGAEPHHGIGVLSATTRLEDQRRILHDLAASAETRQSLGAIRHTFLTVCLEPDIRPMSRIDMAVQAHAGNPANRWFYSSLQLIVFGNGAACVICSFNAYLDGKTMLRTASELQVRAQGISGRSRDQAASADDSTRKVTLRVDSRTLALAAQEAAAIRADQSSVFELPGFGHAFFARAACRPVPTFVAALHVALSRATVGEWQVQQFVSLAHFRYMGVRRAVVTTSEMTELVQFLNSRSHDVAIGAALLARALSSHDAAVLDARSRVPIGLFQQIHLETRSPIGRKYIRFVHRLAQRLLRGFRVQPARPNVLRISTVGNFPGTSIVGRPGVRDPDARRMNLHYQIMPDTMFVTIQSPSHIDNARIVDELKSALIDLSNLRLVEAPERPFRPGSVKTKGRASSAPTISSN